MIGKTIIQRLKQKELIPEDEIQQLTGKARELLIEDPNVVRVNSPVTIVGDLHGQFNDLLQIFTLAGDCPDTNYLFLGGYVNRGINSVSTFLLLLALKLEYPERITILRGNHECRQITQVYGFYDECLQKYNSLNPWRNCVEIFDFLALAAIVDNTYMCMHGGLSPFINSIHDVRTIDRKQEIPNEGSMTDLLWSDPEEIQGYQQNPRGQGCLFGEDIVEKFNKTNKIEMIVRAHQLVMDGYKYDAFKLGNNFKIKYQQCGLPQIIVLGFLILIQRCGNKAAIMIIQDKQVKYKFFDSVEDVINLYLKQKQENEDKENKTVDYFK